MQNSIPCIIRPGKITVVINGETINCNSDSAVFSKVLEAVKAGDEATVLNLLKPIEAVKASVIGTGFTVNGSTVLYNGTPIVQAIATRMLWMIENGFSVAPLENFYKRLANNPSFRAVQELFGFLDACDLPITEDGFFLGYKKVRCDFLDIYTAKIDNSPGKVVNVPRNEVDEDPNRTCSKGLHLCSMSYLSSYGSSNSATDKVVMVKVDPANVVAVPTDYNNAKMRVCEYLVVEEVAIGDIPKYYVPAEVDDEDEDDLPETSSVSTSINIPLRDCKGRFLSAELKQKISKVVTAMKKADIDELVINNALANIDLDHLNFTASKGERISSWFAWHGTKEDYDFWKEIDDKTNACLD